MAKIDIDNVIKRYKSLETDKRAVLSLWQTIADNFYPERADFVQEMIKGDEVADKMVDSYPALIRRDLGNSFAAMLRDGDWFKIGSNVDNLNRSSLMWLDGCTKQLKRLMDNRSSGFVKATKQADHDFAAFGQGVISVEMNRNRSGLLFRNWHLRDCNWWEDDAGNVCGVNRAFRPTVNQLMMEFGTQRLHPTVIEKMQTDPFHYVKCLHVVMTSELYGWDDPHPYVSLYIDLDNNHIIEEMGINHKVYVVPRFQTVAGSQYAFSPATIIALPDARTAQAMMFTLLEAGERYTRPPLIATQKVIRSDVNLSPNGITWVDDEYDEKLGAALRPLQQNMSGFPIGLEQQQSMRETLASAFYLNKLGLPQITGTMTAYEVSERIKQYRREMLPLFAPVESEYSGELCELSFSVSMDNGLLGSPYDVPEQLRGKSVVFEFISPLKDADAERKVNQFQNSLALSKQAAELDRSAIMNLNVDAALRDAISGTGAPPAWLVDEEQVVQQRVAMIQAQQAAAQAAMEQQPNE